MKKIFLLSVVTAFAFASCKDTKSETPTEGATEAQTEAHDDHEGHDHAPGETHAEPIAVQNATPVAASGDMKTNPPHGQPGHRCEIPVGAPLDGSGAQNAPAAAAPQSSSQGFLGNGNAQQGSAQVQQVQMDQQQAAPVQQTAPGMKGKPNPAHGQPGHRCDIAVGQTLP